MMQTNHGHIPLSGPVSDPVLYGVATALSQMFPPVEHPASFEQSDAATEAGHAGCDQDTE
jgi:hypothetical protein